MHACKHTCVGRHNNAQCAPPSTHVCDTRRRNGLVTVNDIDKSLSNVLKAPLGPFHYQPVVSNAMSSVCVFTHSSIRSACTHARAHENIHAREHTCMCTVTVSSCIDFEILGVQSKRFLREKKYLVSAFGDFIMKSLCEDGFILYCPRKHIFCRGQLIWRFATKKEKLDMMNQS